MSIFQLNHCHGENVTQKSNWTIEFFAWADENHIGAEKLPRDEETLLSQTALNLSFCKLTQLPESLANLTHLTELDLAYNELTQIPEWIDNFTVLEKLDVSGNSIMSLPDSLRHLPNLVVLGLDKQTKKENKKMAKKQDWMDELFAWADENNISEEKLPRNKPALFNMIELDLSDCGLTNLHPFIGQLAKLKKLVLSKNQLNDLPTSICKLSNLEDLDLSQNCFITIPESICKLRNLDDLSLDNNQIETLPDFSKLEKLRSLDVSDNKLTDIPENLIKNLNWLVVSGNYLSKEFVEFIKKLTEAHHAPYRNIPIASYPPDVRLMMMLDLGQKLSKTEKSNMKTYQQKILFGSPGTGKSYKIDQQIISNDLKITNSANVIKTVFHPEYTYGDFVGKLMPITVGGNVQYKFYEGHFLKALSQAYKNIIAAQDNDGDCEKVALVIDEINRGNSAAIFGTIFQLLDREPDGWSSYEVSVNEIIFNRLFELCDLKESLKKQGKVISYKFGDEEIEASELQKKLNCHFENRTIKIPPNLSILASMNTSDSSIYYMDSAFKRRWEWEFIDVDSNTVSAEGVAFENRDDWITFVRKLNAFIKSNHKSIRGIEDKQIGHFFITDEQILKSSVQNKLMFFLWDSVFNRDKKPLVKLLFDENTENELITFGDFAKEVDLFIEKINGHV
jgi:Leucine-rich repeat (LRR) protein